MAKKSMIIKQQREPKFSTRRYNRCKSAVVPTLISVNTGSAVSASAILPTRARSRASERHPGNTLRGKTNVTR